jgi:hypothetical protein
VILAGWGLAVLVPLSVLIATIVWPAPPAPSQTDEGLPGNPGSPS